MPIYSSDSDSETTPRTKLFGRQRPIRSVLGGGKGTAVADVLLWENKRVSAALSIGMTILWFLFEVAEYSFVTLFCHISITAMLIVFIWCTSAEIFNWTPPEIPTSILDKSTFHEFASTFHERFNQALSSFVDIACGKQPALFFAAISCLYILSEIGNYFTFLNILYLCFVCLQTLPFLYNKYEDKVERYAGKLTREVKKMVRRINSNVLNKIPRGPVKEKKAR